MGHIREIYWTSDDWPVVAPQRYAGVPDTTITKEDLVGSYEEINLEYRYQTMQQSIMVTLNKDHTVSGGRQGSWDFDKATQTLNINGLELIIDSAWDWEANPRRSTVTYAGINSSGISVWGKKVSN